VSHYNYRDIQMYWNAVFEGVPKFTTDTKIPYPAIMEGIKWLGDNANHVLDFGCGNGKALMVSAKWGVKSGFGMDLSEKGIEIANSVLSGSKLENDFSFSQGDIEALSKLEDESFDGAILFNVLDNLHPEDAKTLIKELCRLLKKGAAVLIKLNPVFEEEVFEEDDEFKKVAPSCYLEESGLLFWNMDEDIINELLEGQFEYVDGFDIEMTDFDTVNRMYCLKKL